MQRGIGSQNFTSQKCHMHGYLASKAYVDGHNIPFPDDLKDVCLQNWKHLKAWISPWLGDGPVLNRQGCLLHMLSLQYDPATKVFSNQPNVNVTFLGNKPFGSVCPVVCLLSSWDTSWTIPCQYFEEEHGYERDVTLLGAPYDWRLTANMVEMDPYFANLTSTFMGNLIINYFLNRRVGKAWQQKYLNGTINVSALWAGSLMLVEQIFSGNANRLQFGGSFEASVLKDYVAQRAKAKLPQNIVKRIKKNFPLRQFVLLDLPADWLLVWELMNVLLEEALDGTKLKRCPTLFYRMPRKKKHLMMTTRRQKTISNRGI
uniref:PMD domain-containing protein n=1 Tax=Globodera pallida TaxID=36090 RepID=A0A183CH09_GLOPA